MGLLRIALELILKDLASRVLRDKLSEAAKRDQQLRAELATRDTRITDLEKKLKDANRQLAIVNGEVNPAEKPSLFRFTVFLSFAPFVLLSGMSLLAKRLSGHTDTEFSNYNHNLGVLGLLGFLVFMATLVGKSATVRHLYTGLHGKTFAEAKTAICPLDVAFALYNAVVYGLGAYGATDPINIAGLCLTLPGILLYPLLPKGRWP